MSTIADVLILPISLPLNSRSYFLVIAILSVAMFNLIGFIIAMILLLLLELLPLLLLFTIY